ncbi:MAG: ABC transporter permease [Nocardioidaceae bacterium]
MTTTEQTVRPQPEPIREPFESVAHGWRHQVRATWVVLRRELLRFGQDRTRMFVMLIQPLLFLFVMGTGLSSIVSTGGNTSFRTFLFPGVLATSVLFTAAFSGISLVWDREFGFLREMLVAPIGRASIIVGKCLGGAIVATLQSLILLAMAGLVDVPYDPWMLLGLIGCLFLGALLLTSIGVVMSTRIKTIQAAMPASQLLITPMMFLSGSLFPINGLPYWLSVLTRVNPLTYVVQPMRHLVLAQLHLTQAERARLLPDITWFGWHVPVGIQLLLVLACALGLMSLAVASFRKSE